MWYDVPANFDGAAAICKKHRDGDLLWLLFLLFVPGLFFGWCITRLCYRKRINQSKNGEAQVIQPHYNVPAGIQQNVPVQQPIYVQQVPACAQNYQQNQVPQPQMMFAQPQMMVAQSPMKAPQPHTTNQGY